MQTEYNEKQPFIYTAAEAAEAARCELGVGSLPRDLSAALVLGFLAVLLGRSGLGLSLLPPFSVLGAYAAAAAAWCIFMVYIRIRLKQTEAAIKSRSLTLAKNESGFCVYEYETQPLYHTAFADISALKKQLHTLHITAPMGRICLPARLFTEQEMQLMLQHKA